MHTSAQNALSMSLPNLPGVLPSNDSWIHRQRDGFHRSSRPKSANLSSTATRQQLNNEFANTTNSLFKTKSTDNEFGRSSNYNTSNQESEVATTKMYVRPASATINRSKTNMLSTTPSDILPSDLYVQQRFVRPNRLETFDRYGDSSNNKTSRTILTNFGVTKEILPSNKARQFPLVPRYIENEKIVCRFYGYFFEDRNWPVGQPLGEPNIEKKITRKLTILYYCEDDSVSMAEHVPNNSGLMGGSFFKRGLLNKEDGSQVVLEDLAPGNSLFVLGREIFIHNCDDFTRNLFSEELNIVLPPPLEEPPAFREDVGALYATGLSSRLPSQKTTHGTKSNKFFENQESNDRMSRYFKYDGKALRFLCIETKDILDNQLTNYDSNRMRLDYITISERSKKYALSYFLVDRSIDIRVVKSLNGQMSTGPKNLEDSVLVMKKSKIARNWREVQASSMVVPRYFEPEDFYCGQIVDIYGRKFLLVNCDNSTRSTYHELGIEQREIFLQPYEEKPIVHPIPRMGDGFIAIGSEEATLATVYGMPKVSRDAVKAHKNQHRILRCRLKMCSTNSIDASRNFMLTFYLEDDTVHIFEDSPRNSGIQSGTFLKRGKYKNGLPPDSHEPRYFIPTDVYLGNVFSINGTDMKITEMDNLSLKFCETYPDEFPYFDSFRIASKVSSYVKENHIQLRMIFDNLASSSSNKGKEDDVLSKDKIIQVLNDTNITDEINEQEVLTLIRRIQSDSTPTNCHYHELCDLLSHAAYYRSNEERMMYSNGEENRICDDIKTFIKFARTKHTQWRRLFRKDYRSIHNFISLDVALHLLRKKGLQLTDSCIEQLRSRYAVNSLVAQTYHKQLQMNISQDRQQQQQQQQQQQSRSNQGRNKSNFNATSTAASSLFGQSGQYNNTAAKRMSKTTDGLFTSSSHSIGFEQSSEMSILPTMPSRNLTIAEKREYLMTMNKLGGGSMQASMMEPQQDDGSVIDYSKLCNDIYVCDWV